MTDPRDRGFDLLDDRFDGEGGDSGAQANPLLIVHRRLRGRYLLAAALGLLLAAPGAILGWSATKVEYQSIGQIEVRATMPRLIYTTPDNEATPFIDRLVQNELTHVTMQRTLMRAASDPQLRQAGWPAPPAGVAALQESVVASAARLGSTIAVAVTNTDPRLAQMAVNAVLRAYKESYDERYGEDAVAREDALQRIVADLQTRLMNRRNELFTLSSNLGAETLPGRFESKAEDLARYDALLTSLDLALVEARNREGRASDEGVAGYTLDELALRDGVLASMIGERDTLQARQRTMGQNLLPNHRAMQELARQIREVEQMITVRAEAVAAQAAAEEAGDAGVGGAASVEELTRKRAEYEADRNRISAEVNDLASKLRLVEATRAEIADIESRLEDAGSNLNALRVERENRPPGVERVEIIEGETPLVPSRDKRLPLAAAGAAAGLGCGVGLVFLYGLARPTYRYIDDVETVDSVIPLLGTLPDFSSGDPEQRDLAALSVHHLRNALGMGSGRSGGRVLTITSASSGDGKTSLAMALGTSFAAAGQKTCLVDSDLVGRGLTRELGMTRRDGFAQAVEQGHVHGAAVETPVRNLWAMPTGLIGGVDPTRLSERNVRPVVDALRAQFDIVLIDTGPLLGSLEANVVAAVSDSVIVAVSRGQSARLVRAAMERLKRIGVKCDGIVFNRAGAVDFRSSVSHASIRSASYVARPGEEERATRPGSRASLMDAVAGVVQIEGEEKR